MTEKMIGQILVGVIVGLTVWAITQVWLQSKNGNGRLAAIAAGAAAPFLNGG